MESSVAERFEAKFTPEPMTGCWLWTAALHEFGYGKMYAFGVHDVAHRVAYKLYVGDVPAGQQVLHRCDVPACVNPAHLFLGTQKDNINDMDRKGRRGKAPCSGERNGEAKLTAEQAHAIRSDPRAHREIAVEYGIGKSQVTRIKARQSWK